MRRIETKYKKNLSSEELNMILTASRRKPIYHLIFKIMAYMGLRVNEVLQIKKNDISPDFENLRLQLEKTNGRIIQRVIPNRIKPAIRKLTKKIKQGDYIFKPSKRSNSRNLHITTASVRWFLSKIRNKLNLKDIYYVRKNGSPLYRISNHTFRHFFITRLYEVSGHDLVLTKNIIGHKKIETTEGYISPVTKEKDVVNLI